ncbi:MAG: GMC family oxidoreductase [Oculatellaceae cyanobacterium bins.114]|nr:GMC family oxidoreductase [Oculatellaceae cyanobacterium bins.114]
MLIDARTLPINETIETEICIVGTGPAGTTIARELAGKNFRVCLLESGGLEFDEATQSLSAGKITTPHFYPTDELTRGRCRQFGGSSNYWDIKIQRGEEKCHVRHAPLDPIDFEKREWLPYSGWPFDYNHLVPYYERAQEYCQAGPFQYDGASWETDDARVLSMGDRITTGVFQFGPSAAFAHVPRQALQNVPNITSYYNAHVLNIETNETATQVSRLRVASAPNREFWVAARIVILATGGFENARLLLLSNQTQSTGLGNQHDLVGRYFMDHPGFRIGVLIPTNRKIFDIATLYDLRRVRQTPILGRLAIAPEVMRQEKLLNSSIMLVPKPIGYGLAAKPLMTLVRSAKQGKLPEEAIKKLQKVLTNLDDTALYAYRRARKLGNLYTASRGGWSTLPDRSNQFRFLEAVAQVEQVPDPTNRVMLGNEQDPFGRRRIEFYWQWTDLDLQSLRRTAAILKEDFAQSGIGQFQTMYELNGATNIVNGKEVPRFQSTHHHIGTTRMHPDPTQGVVDANGKVHGISNLYITGSSVFPTGGYANPTLTLVALAVRLAEHMNQVMGNTAVTVESAAPTI